MRVLIVDDSVVYRTAIKTALSSTDKGYEIDVAANGKIAIDKLKQKSYDIITLDLEMPVMDGMETIKEIRTFDTKLPIIIFSAQNLNAANKTLQALEMGANDFVSKIEGSSDLQENLKMINDELIPKFEALTYTKNLEPKSEPVASPAKFTQQELEGYKPNLLCFGSSTGGPDVLKRVFRDLKTTSIPILVVQHMPPVFTTQLANSLNEVSAITVVEAKDGDLIKPGHAYVAPGDYHMTLEKADNNYVLRLNQGAKVCYVRPAVDVMMQSVANNFTGGVVGVVFTGMGSDGADGCVALKNKNARIMIQSEDSSVVWGMPKAVYDAGAFDAIKEPLAIVSTLNKMVNG